MTEKINIILNDNEGLAEEVGAITDELRRVFADLLPVVERAQRLDARVSIAVEKWVNSLPDHIRDDAVSPHTHDVLSELAYFEMGGRAMTELLHSMSDALSPELANETPVWLEWTATGRDEWRASREAVAS